MRPGFARRVARCRGRHLQHFSSLPAGVPDVATVAVRDAQMRAALGLLGPNEENLYADAFAERQLAE